MSSRGIPASSSTSPLRQCSSVPCGTHRTSTRRGLAAQGAGGGGALPAPAAAALPGVDEAPPPSPALVNLVVSPTNHPRAARSSALPCGARRAPNTRGHVPAGCCGGGASLLPLATAALPPAGIDGSPSSPLSVSASSPWSQ